MQLDIPKATMVPLSPCDVADEIVELTRAKAEAEDRFVSMVDGLASLTEQDRIVVINYLKQDPTIAQIVGDDPKLYYTRLTSKKEDISNESVVGLAIGILAAYLIHKYRDSFYALRKSLTNGEVPDDSWLADKTSSRLVLTYEVFKENNEILINGYKALRNLIDKKDPQEEDFKRVADALRLKVPTPRSGGDFVKGGIIGWLAGVGVGLLLHVGVICPLASLFLMTGKFAIAQVASIAGAASAIASWFVAIRTGSNVSNKTAATYGSKGWTSTTVEWARKECLARIKDMDDMVAALKSHAEMDPQKQKAMRTLLDLLAEGVKGLCISTARILK